MIFADTSFWVALRNRRDAHHVEAAALLAQRSGDTILVTNHVLGETWTFLRRRAGHAAAVGFLDTVARSPRIRVHHLRSPQEQDAIGWLRRHDEREYSFVDATSFVAMRDHALIEALAFGGDFAAAGFVELRSL